MLLPITAQCSTKYRQLFSNTLRHLEWRYGSKQSPLWRPNLLSYNTLVLIRRRYNYRVHHYINIILRMYREYLRFQTHLIFFFRNVGYLKSK